MAKNRENKQNRAEPRPAADIAPEPAAAAPIEAAVDHRELPAALDQAQIGTSDDVAPAAVAVVPPAAEPFQAATVTDAPHAGTLETTGLPLVPSGDPGKPVRRPTTPYMAFFKERPQLQIVPGYMKRSFELDRVTAEKLNRLLGAMQAVNVVGPEGIKVDSPDRALAVLVHFVHDNARD